MISLPPASVPQAAAPLTAAGKFMRLASVLALGTCSLSLLQTVAAEEVWTAPTPFPEERYENGWRKNPFTLKTAPVAIQRESFAKNLALGSMYDDAEGVTSVVVVNTKTRDRVRLRGQEPASNGMRVTESVIADTRRDSYAVVVMGGEKATLRYDEAFLKQLAAGGGSPSNTNAGTAAKKTAANGAEGEGQPAANMTTALNGAPASAAGMGAAPPSPTSMVGGSPVPTPPGIRPTASGGRPTTMSRRRLTAPQGVTQPPPPPLAPTDNP